jgi:hypothetical protein
MKLIKPASGGIHQTKEVPGLLDSRIDYEIKSGTGWLDYTGPKFSPEMWHQVLSFFHWTHQTMASESQVRLYVNLTLGRWAAWAFPQAARTGMSARELAVPETAEQAAARFATWNSKPSADWLYFGTVHHHCSAGAFQSGTDEANEQNQDGLHLTVGRLDADRHDLHARFYLNGDCFAPDLSRFWPVEPELVAQVPDHLLDELARFQMGTKIETDFPGIWRQNIIEVRTDYHPLESHVWPELDRPRWVRTEQALHEIASLGAANSLGDEELLSALHSLVENPALSLIVETCRQHQLDPDELLAEVRQVERGY